jgi:hypothetical protein
MARLAERTVVAAGLRTKAPRQTAMEGLVPQHSPFLHLLVHLSHLREGQRPYEAVICVSPDFPNIIRQITTQSPICRTV